MKKTGAERLDKSSADAIHWAECLSEQMVIVSDPTDVGWLVGWLASYSSVVHGPLVKEVQELRQENKVLRESLNASLQPKPDTVRISRECAGEAREALAGQIIASKAVTGRPIKTVDKAYNEINLAIKQYEQALEKV